MISAARDRASVVLDFDVGASRYRIARTLRRNGAQMVRLEERDGKSLADKVGAANAQVVQILGLEAPAFLQAVVLPQGEFARFLKAQPRDRRGMLRTLLRLDVYERMRERAQRSAVARKSAVDSLRKLLSDEYAGVDEAAVARLEAEHARIVESLASWRKNRDEIQAGLARLRGQHAKTRELQQVEEKLAALREQAEQIHLVQARIEAAARAAPLLPLLDEAARASASAAAAAKAADEARAALDSARKEWTEKATALKAAERAAKAIKKIREQVSRLHQVLGRLPEREQLQAGIARQTRDLKALEGEISTLAATVESAQAVQAEQQVAVDAARQAVEASGYDPELDELLQGVRDLAVVLGAARKSEADQRAELARKRKAVKEQARKIKLLEKEAASARKSAEEAQRGLEAAEEALHRLDEASHLRAGLVPGQPCPVCEQVVDTPPPAHLAPDLEAARVAFQGARETCRQAEALARQNEAALTSEQARLQAAQQGLAELESLCAALQANIAAGEVGIWGTLGDHAPQEVASIEAWIEKQIAALAKSRKTNEEAKALLSKAEQTLERAKVEETTARERLGEREASRKRLEEERGASLQRLATLQEEIRAVTESDDPAAEAEALEEQIQQLEADLKTASDEQAAAQTRLTAAQEAQRLKAESADAARQEAARRAESRDAEIARAGFEDEAAVREARLDKAEAARLEEQVRRHAQDSHAAEERVAALGAELGDERVSDEQLAEAEQLAAQVTGEVETALGQQKTLEGQVALMKERLEKSRALRKQLDIEEAALPVYELLATDLRSDRFQSYVLQEVFTELVQGASDRLMRLTQERYSLRFHDDEIRVVDHDNADETRISDTLSGGETFLTSLALALELSDQVQRAVGAVNLDSLFIDEGFGTLDPDTLALVAETLQSLRVGGRMVGIITHIPELRDEFAQQILVTKHQGYSTVEVRGVVEVA